LPKPKELLTIVGTNSGPFPFPSGDDTTFSLWTSKKSVLEPTKAWYVMFRKISVTNHLGYLQTTSTSVLNNVRCVRGEILPENSSFTEFTPEGTTNVVIKDNVTGLFWQKAESSSELTWEEALKYCADSTYAGFTDWRLPNKEELISIINFDRANPATDLPGIGTSAIWTSSTSRNNQYKRAFYVLTNSSGSMTDASKTTTHRAHCVR
ncbi:DUF1566 domain-containing protein, partial [bacterium]|nr:DUF1566 domain-containing protein [bacterium]